MHLCLCICARECPQDVCVSVCVLPWGLITSFADNISHKVHLLLLMLPYGYRSRVTSNILSPLSLSVDRSLSSD